MESFHAHVYLKNPNAWSRIGKDIPAISDEEVAEAYNTDPQADSYKYINSLIHALHRVGQLPQAMIILKERMQLELFQLIETAINDVEDR